MRLLITFETTYEVMMFEQYAKKSQVAGKIYPVPRKYSANCGLAWISPIEERDMVLNLITRYDLSYDKIYDIE